MRTRKTKGLLNPDNIRTRTAEARGEPSTTAPAETPEQARLRAIAEVIRDNSFGCAKESVTRLVTAIVGELPDVSGSSDGSSDGRAWGRSGALISAAALDDSRRTLVLVTDVDSVGDMSYVRSDLRPDSYVFHVNDWRYATDREVERWLRQAGLI